MSDKFTWNDGVRPAPTPGAVTLTLTRVELANIVHALSVHGHSAAMRDLHARLEVALGPPPYSTGDSK